MTCPSLRARRRSTSSGVCGPTKSSRESSRASAMCRVTCPIPAGTRTMAIPWATCSANWYPRGARRSRLGPRNSRASGWCAACIFRATSRPDDWRGMLWKAIAPDSALRERRRRRGARAARGAKPRGHSSASRAPPRLALESAIARPPCRAAIRATMASPRPNPPVSRLRLVSSRVKARNTAARSASGIPSPSSSTTRRQSPFSRATSMLTLLPCVTQRIREQIAQRQLHQPRLHPQGLQILVRG